MFSTHFNPSQKSNDRINDAIAYTSASTALYQKLSVNVKVSEPKVELPNILIASIIEMFFLREIKPFIKCEIDQNKNRIVSALDVTDIIFIDNAI